MLWGHGWLMAIAPLESVLWLCYPYFSKSHDNMFSQVLTFPGRSVNWIFYIRSVLPGPLNFAYCLPNICRHVSLFLIYNFIYVFLAVLGLHCCAGSFSSCGVWASHSGGFYYYCRAQALGCMGFSSCGTQAYCPTARGIFLGQGSNPYPRHWQVNSLPLSHQGNPYMSLMILLYHFWEFLERGRIMKKSYNKFIAVGRVYGQYCKNLGNSSLILHTVVSIDLSPFFYFLSFSEALPFFCSHLPFLLLVLLWHYHRALNMQSSFLLNVLN